jgi:hypothetical protein
MSVEFQKAKDSLQITDVYLKGLSAELFNDFEPKFDSNIDELDEQSKHYVRKADMIEFDDTKLLRVFVELGIRLVDTKLDKNIGLKAQIEAEFVVEYIMSEDLDQSAIDEFALKNSSYHVWPYWRELLMSQCTRMHLPRLALPTLQVAQNHNQVDEVEKGS